VGMILHPAVLSFLVALAVSALMVRIAPRHGFVAVPGRRGGHRRRTPLLGGVGIVAGVYAGAAYGWLLDPGWGGSELRPSLVFLGCALAMAVVGLVDDRFELHTRGKLLAQFGPIAIFAAYLIGVSPAGTFSALDGILMVVFLVGIVNTMNFQDNMDGLLAGLSCLLSLALGTLLGFACFPWGGGALPYAGFLSVLLFILAGASLGFLWLNRPPASLFMGDTGSLFLGFVLGGAGVLAAFTCRMAHYGFLASFRDGPVPVGASMADPPLLGGASEPWIFLTLLFGVPVMDGGLVVVSRIRHRRVLTAGSTDHISHRLMALGFSTMATLRTLYLATLACAALAVAYVPAANPIIPLGALAVALPLLVKLYLAPVYEEEAVKAATATEEP